MTTPSSPSAAGQALHFIIYSRSYCHLCEDLRDALRQALGEIPAVIEMVDVDADEALVARYDELVPVLMGQGSNGRWQELCHYHLDKARLQAFVAEMK